MTTTDGLAGVVIRRAGTADLPAVEALLARASLPLAGVADGFGGFLVAEARGQVAGAIGMEGHGPFGLLRSAVVDEDWRGRGLGIELTRRVLAAARADRRQAIYLLTTTAANFFERFGFRSVERAAVPDAVKESVEFRGACPASATVMRLDLA